MKSQKKVTKQYRKNQGFSYFFCLVTEGSRSGSGSIPLTGSGSIRIQEAQKYVDPGDPDPQHCCILSQCGSGSEESHEKDPCADSDPKTLMVRKANLQSTVRVDPFRGPAAPC